MSTDDTTPAEPKTPEQLEADIERQREELAATVGQLQAKLDVKARAKVKATELQDRATTDTGKPRPDLAAGAAAVLVLIVGVLVWRRRRSH